MGALWGLLVRGLTVAGPAAIGYFFNDAATWIGNLFARQNIAVTTTRNGATRFAWWFVVLVFALLGVVGYFILNMLRGRRKKLFIFLGLTAACYALDTALGLGGGLVAAEIIGSIAAATTDVIRVQYTPEYVTFNRAVVPTSFITDVTGDGVIFNLDGAGLTNLNGIRCVGELPANQFLYQIANGYINKPSTFTIANPAGAVLDVHAFSDSPGGFYTVHGQAQAFAGQSLLIEDFYYAAFPSAAATDRFTVTFADGTTQVMLRLELESYLAYKQEVTATRFNIDNYDQSIRAIQFLGAATQTVYFTRRWIGRGTVNQGLPS